ncbi:MAG: ATP-binding cassette domain-containing protein [Spirochaetia bacterium]|nr:ATP-binding cassette domain-containing protein [Spirochaetia bacterium]
MNTIVTVSHLTFSYPDYGLGSRSLFEDLSFTLYEGQMHMIFGEPESGKTTLSRILCALVPAYLGGKLTGSIRFKEQLEITQVHPNELTPLIGLVFQNPEEQIIMAACEDEIIFPLENLGLSRQEIGSRVETVLERYELTSYRHTNPGNLSGGEKKRLMLAVTDAIDPDLWVLDETFEELDSRWRQVVLTQLKERKKSVVLFASKDTGLYHEFFDLWGLLGPAEGGAAGCSVRFGEVGEICSAFSGSRRRQIEHREIIRDESQALTRVDDLTFRYAEPMSAFDLSVDRLCIYRGEILALYGPNGSGKSTLSSLLCGLIEPHGGTISIRAHQEWVHAQPQQLLRHTGYLFQNPDLQIFLPTIEDELRYGLIEQGIHGKRAEELIDDAVERFSLGNRKEPPTIMSYGKRKRLQAAVYYLLERTICILDETDSGLSDDEFFEILMLLSEHVDAVVLITHDKLLAQQCAHRIVYMDEGRIVREQSL